MFYPMQLKYTWTEYKNIAYYNFMVIRNILQKVKKKTPCVNAISNSTSKYQAKH